MTEPRSDHGMFSPGNEAGIDPAYTDPDKLDRLADEATPGPWTPGAKWRTIQGATAQAVNDPDGNEIGHSWFTPEDARLIALAPTLAREHAALLRWADEAAKTLGDGGSHAFVGTGEWCDVCGFGGAYWQHAAHAVLAALDAMGGHQ